MIIDAHQHVFWHGRDDAGLVADLDEQGIDRCWLLTWELPSCPVYIENLSWSNCLNPARARPDGTHPGIILDDLLIARRRYPDRFVLGYCPDPTNPAAPELFEQAVRMYGVQVCGEWKFRMLIDDPRSLELFRMAGRLGAPVVLHLDVPYLPDAEGNQTYKAAWYGGTVTHLARALEACPETRFIGHAPGFWREISGDADASPSAYPAGTVSPCGRLPQLFDRYPNLYADLSAGSGLRALSRDPEHAQAFVSRYADRLLFARDQYGADLQAFLKTLDLSHAVRGKLMSGNALSLLNRCC